VLYSLFFAHSWADIRRGDPDRSARPDQRASRRQGRKAAGAPPGITGIRPDFRCTSAQGASVPSVNALSVNFCGKLGIERGPSCGKGLACALYFVRGECIPRLERVRLWSYWSNNAGTCRVQFELRFRTILRGASYSLAHDKTLLEHATRARHSFSAQP